MSASTLETNDNRKRSIAERMYDGSFAKGELGNQLYEAGVELERIGFDGYDCSLELYGVPADYRLSDEVQKIVFDAGFSKVYVNHDDKWETHYSFAAGEFKPVKGWRVSYPHRRNDGSNDIWVEKHVVGWPADWFKTGYVKIKQWLCP